MPPSAAPGGVWRDDCPGGRGQCLRIVRRASGLLRASWRRGVVVAPSVERWSSLDGHGVRHAAERRCGSPEPTQTTGPARTSADERKPRQHGAKTEAVRTARLSRSSLADDRRGRKSRYGESTLLLVDRDAAFWRSGGRRHTTFRRPSAGSRLTGAPSTLADCWRQETPTVRLGAARTVAEIGMHQYDSETILKKLDDLEASQRRR